MPKYSFNTQAFTLIELVMTMAIAGILVTIAIPSFNSTLTSSRLTNYANDLVGALNLARSEAVRRGVSVTVRKIDNFSYTNLGAGVNWETGWDIFTDINNDGKFDVGDALIRTYPQLQSSYTLRGNNNFINYIRYTPLGISNSIGSFVICNNSDGNNIPEKYTSKLITINFSGRPHMGVDSNDNGIPEKENGTEIISCTVSPF
jgi:type IV fimbrial biogenesis protein FimT